MKRIFTLLNLVFLVALQGFAQTHVNYDRDSRWFIGLNGGGTWTTQTEVPYRIRGGAGLTFGKSFGMERDKIFSWDVRARFLYAQVAGQADDKYVLDSTTIDGLDAYGTETINQYKDSIGYFVPNYQSNLVRGSLELVLNTNRLRQRTGWNLSVFGGLGITGYHTATDLVGSNGGIYDYNTNGQISKSDAQKLQDGVYETNIVGEDIDYNVDWMPSFGFGISKQIHPAVALGLEHKMTWTRTNLFDGMPNNLNGTSSSLNDKYHYTALTLKFHLWGGKASIDPVADDFDKPDDPTPIKDPVVDPVKKQRPIVDIYDPSTSPYQTTSNTFRIKANIHHVDKSANVTFKQDGNINTSFSYNPTTDKFEANVILHPGQNLFEISGVNEAGSDYESVIIVYEKEEEVIAPPIVTITNPPYSPYFTNSSVFGLVSTVLNVDTKAQIHVYLNGVNLTSFSYGLDTKVLSSSLNLIEGTNTVTVTATNAAGSDSKTVEINYKKPETIQPPIVSFVTPNKNPHFTTIAVANIKATALNVKTKGDLTIRVNGNLVTNFSFNTTTKEIVFSMPLMEGANDVTIKGVNKVGADIANTTIIYTKPETPKPPIVTFVDPNVSPITVYTPTYNVTAKVLNVDSKSDITLKINGVNSTSFSYSTSSDLMNFTTSLVEGSNVIEVKGTNEYGVDIETTTIIYKRTIPQAPPIVNITYPNTDNQIFENPTMTLVASVLNVSSAANISVVVNGTVTTAFTYNVATKVLNLPLVLNSGTNTVQITGTNATGSATKTRTIIYKKPIVPKPPTVNFINPPSSPFVVTVPAFNLTASTTNINAKDQIVLKQNGVVISSGSYAFVAGHQIIYNATLISGNNIFEVTVTNADGSATDLAIVTLDQDEEPCIIPTVGYIHPVPYSTVTDPAVTIDAQINNHSPETTVELRLNGVSKGYMAFNEATSIAAKSITLNEGSNAINVIVTNSCGTNQATFTLNYEAPDAPCLDPILSTTDETSFTTLKNKVSLALSSANVTNATELDVKVNGTTIPFGFDAATGTITINDIALSIGTNSVIVTAKTACGGTVLVYTIKRDECKSPTVSSLSHLNGATTEDESIIFTAAIENAKKEEISFLVNGISQSFSYNEATNAFAQAIPLEVGENTITLNVENVCGKATKTIKVVREIPCQTIVTNLLVPTTNTVTVTESKYTVTLNATGLTNDDKIIAKLNDVEIPTVFDIVSGNITVADFDLKDGENTLVFGLINPCSKASVRYTINYNGCKAPAIIINDPKPDATVTESVYNLSAVVTNISDAADILVTLNGSTIDFDFNGATHLLTASLSLLEGVNTIRIDASGCEKASASTNLTYKVPCDKITATLMQPATLESVAYASNFNAALSVFGIDNAEQIEVKLNGVSIPFTFDSASNVIYINDVLLTDGANSINVRLKNECSSDVINYTVNYDACKPPVITFGSLPAEVSVEAYNFEATVSNITMAGDISLLLNGAPVPFVFDPASGLVSATMVLTPDTDNTIALVANGCEKATKTTKVRYTIPCLPITYTLGHPNTPLVKTAEETYDVNLIVQHVSLTDITVKNNGTVIPFSYADNLLSINGIALVGGTNTVVVTLKNACSEETITYTIEHNDCSAPEITLASNASAVENSAYTFVASITNIERADQLQVKLNGTTVPFEFYPATNSLTVLMTLIEGNNVIEVIANGCAKATEKLNVVYTVPCSPVTYTLVAPEALIVESAEPSIDITLNTTEVDNADMVSATLNGTVIPVKLTGSIINLNNVKLVSGENTIAVTFKNSCSTETVTYKITHEPCTTPTVAFIAVTEGMEVAEETKTIDATVTGAEKENILVRFNGVLVPFEYNTTTNKVSVDLTLVEGSNEIEIIAEGCETVTKAVNITHNPPCLVPSCTRVMPTTETVRVEGDSYAVTLSVNNVVKEQIRVQLNGTEKPFTLSGNTLIFEVPRTEELTVAATVTLTNDCGTETVNSTVEFAPVEEDCKPSLFVDFSEDLLEAEVTSNMELINVILKLSNGATQTFDDIEDRTGTFMGVREHEGECIVGVWVRSGCNVGAAGEPYGLYIANPDWEGECEEAEEPCDEVGYTLVTPTKINETTTNAQYQVVLNTVNVESEAGVRAKVNGMPSPISFSDNQATVNWFALKAGVNIIQVTLLNDCSMETITYFVTSRPEGKNINLDKPTDDDSEKQNENKNDLRGDNTRVQSAPVITMISPAKINSTVTNQTLSLRTKVANIDGRSAIKINVNGANFQGFNYNTKTEQLSAIVRLKEGVNMIKIIASNDKTTDLTYTVTYKKEASVNRNNTRTENTNNNTERNNNAVVKAPQLYRVNPNSANVFTEKSTYMLKFKAANISSKSDIKLVLNGQTVTNFSYSSSTQLVSAVLRLRSGNNSLVATATKNGKSASLSYSITYTPKKVDPVLNNNNGRQINRENTSTENKEKGQTKTNNGVNVPTPQKPVFKFISPTTTYKTVKTPNFTLKTKVLNVTKRSAIRITLNGTVVNGFSFNSSTKELVTTLRLREGTNTIQVTANNSGKRASVNYTIKYEAPQPIKQEIKKEGTKEKQPTKVITPTKKENGNTRINNTGTEKSSGSVNRRNG